MLKTDPDCPGRGDRSRRGRYTLRVYSVNDTDELAIDVRCDIHGTIDDTTSGL